MSVASQLRSEKRPNPQARKDHVPQPNKGHIPFKGFGQFAVSLNKPVGAFGGVTVDERAKRERLKFEAKVAADAAAEAAA